MLELIARLASFPSADLCPVFVLIARAERQPGERKRPFNDGKDPLRHPRDFSKAKRKTLDFALQRCLRSPLREVSRSYEKETRCPIRFH